MKKYSFRLENVLRVRRIQEDIAKGELLGANTEVQNAIKVVEARLADYEVQKTPRSHAVTVEGFMRTRYFNDLSGKAVVAARASQASAAAEASIKKAAFSDAARRTKAIDRLKDRSREEYAVEMQRASDHEMDEIANSRFRRPTRTALGNALGNAS